jgi:hypothetical protein
MTRPPYKTPLYLKLLGIAAVLALVIYLQTRESDLNKRYFNELGLILKGVVLHTDVRNGHNGFGIIRLHVLESNKPYYDPRKQPDYFYAVIHGDSAEIYQGSAASCEPGDTIRLNTLTRDFIINKTSGESVRRDMVLYANESFYKHVRKNSSFTSQTH